MVVPPQKTGKRISGHLLKRGMKEPLTTREITTIKEGVCQAMGKVTAEAHSILRIACTTGMI
jgi:hypothetical protein